LIDDRLENFAPATAQKNINLGILDEVIIPLPPIEEQKRIVTKVNELMKICDRVAENLSKKEELANQISASVIHHLDI
jgi:type I restriction enzyme S subunit